MGSSKYFCTPTSSDKPFLLLVLSMKSLASWRPDAVMRIFLLLFGFLGFIIANDVCHRPLNVLLLGYNGAGKSTIVNVLGGLAREIAPTGSSIDSFTKECKMYSLTYGGRSLNVVDTPGFGPSEQWNTKLRKKIATKVPSLFGGIDAVMFVIPVKKVKDRDLIWIDFFNSYINQDKLIQGKLSQGIIVFTYADDIPMDPRYENEIMSQILIKSMFPKFMFYRHESGNRNGVSLGRSEVRSAFRNQVYNDLFSLCEANNGNTFNTNEMIKTTEEFEYQKLKSEEYRKIREALETSFMRIRYFSDRVSTDLRVKVNKVLDSAPQSFIVRRSVIQDITYRVEDYFYQHTKQLREYVKEHDFLKRQLRMVSRNVTVLADAYSIARQKYNIEKDSFISQTEEIKAVQCGPLYNPSEKNFGQALLMAMLPGSEFALRMLCHNIRQNIQRELDSVPKYYIDKYMTRAGFNNDNFDIPVLDNNKPSINDYLARIELLEEKTARISNRITEIRQLKEEMRNAVYLVEDYEHKEKIIEEGGILFAHPQMKQMIFKQKVVVMNETQRFQGDRRIFF
ncbi:hypothetical protein ROZALSC1DRAFT_24911 [Rozella allomycis CSF55]|uniref:AIG1-type G domain-containing protein n=1 Tax=Rozella allomycis (strain CSF55) TaxID=988480 RepID=A0A4P9YD22_ROZAC|nr:hypothetical protein ROZALSC1DRAFT_24911 [Rozella allomycis CSF55]